MTVKEIIVKWLKDNGYDGLASDTGGGCGCSVDDFMPCDENCADCCPAYHWECSKCSKEIQSECDFAENNDGCFHELKQSYGKRWLKEPEGK